MRKRDIESMKVGKEFRELLSGHHIFEGDEKAIVRAWQFLQIIQRLGQMKWDVSEAPSRHHDENKATFAACKWSHVVYLRSLGDETVPPLKGDTMRVEHLRLFKTKPHKVPLYGLREGQCRGYILTPYCRQLLADGDMEWVAKSNKDRTLKRRYMKARRRALVSADGEPNPFVRMVRKMCCEVELDEFPEGVSGDASWQTAACIRRELLDADFDEMGIQHGRLYHPLVRLPRVCRHLLRLGKMRRLATADIRCCWPTFYARCLKGFYRKGRRRIAGVDAAALEGELDRWEALFCADKDPRLVLIEDKRVAPLGMSKAQMKDALNRWINGGKQMEDGEGKQWRKPMRALDRWLAEEFPQLSKLKAVVSGKRYKGYVARRISTDFESPIMMDMELYALGEQLGFRLIPEHDGVGVFALPKRPPAQYALRRLSEKIRELSIRHTGVPVFVKAELVS